MFSDRQKRAIHLFKSYESKLVYEISDKDKQAAKTILNLLEKQDKIINEMAKEMFYENNRNVELQNFENYEQIIEYFKNK